MPGPTTEVLNEDIKEIKAELRDIRGGLDTLKAEVHGIAVGLAELRAEVRVSLAQARWAGTLLVATMLGGGVSAIWWASGLTAEVHRLAEVVNSKSQVQSSIPPALRK